MDRGNFVLTTPICNSCQPMLQLEAAFLFHAANLHQTTFKQARPDFRFSMSKRLIIMMSELNDQVALLKQLRADLERKYKQHAQRVQVYWTAFDHSKRAACIKAGTLDGAVLNNRQDTALGQVHRIMPEWNLRDLASSNPSVLLDMLKFRATTNLFDQYRSGPNGTPGNAEFIRRAVQNGLRPSQPRPNCYSLFMDEEHYGESYDVGHQNEQAVRAIAPAVRAGLCVPQSTGDVIVTTHINLLQSLTILIDDIPEQGSTTRNTTKCSPKPREPLVASSSKAGSSQTCSVIAARSHCPLQ